MTRVDFRVLIGLTLRVEFNKSKRIDEKIEFISDMIDLGP